MESNTTQGPSYKDTLNLPNTPFPMKADLAIREPEIIKMWEKENIYQQMIEKNSQAQTFAMPDGPPYANGNLHMGHALNKILKDIVIKYQNLKGRKAVFIPGWDCHGLPIEQGVLKALGPKAKEANDTQIRDLCRKEANKWIDVQREQFKRFGLLADWENPYRTLDPDYEAETVRTLAKILKTGAFYRGEKPVYWCLPLQTALAEAEVEYHNHKSPSVYVKFNLKSDVKKWPEVARSSKPVSFVIWTTTPWTLPANLAIAVHPDFDYGFFDTGSDILVLAEGLWNSFSETTGTKGKSLGITVKGKDLENLKTQHPFISRESPIVLGTHVTLEAGTGCVHTAPGHGQDDYKVGQQYGLPVYSPVDHRGCYTKDVPEYEGMKVFDANPLIVERLRASGHLLHFVEIEHSYPHCWRTKTPLIFRATPQWFLGMDLEINGQKSIRETAVKAIKEVNWVPKWGENRIHGMISLRPDWCLSRQRTWGVPIPVFYCSSCQHELADEKIMNFVADCMEKEGGIEAYHKYDANHFTQGRKCTKCGRDSFVKGKDILDVWFDSGVCFSAVQKRREGLTHPADLYLEGSDQHRGWFHTSLLAAVASDGKAPYKTVLTHGFVMFAKGQKMSKSLGNVVDPLDIIKKNGAELLRLWAAHEDYAQDLSANPESFLRLTETYRRMRNTVRFILGNISDLNPKSDTVPVEFRSTLDKWILAKTNELIKNVTEAYEKYEFYKIYHFLNNYVTVELSSVYLDILKDRLYTAKKTGTDRRAAQSTLLEILETLVGLMAPIFSFLAEETYGYLPGEKKKSVFMTSFPKANSKWEQSTLVEKFEHLLEARSGVSKVLEDLRRDKVIGASLEAEVEVITENQKWIDIFESIQKTDGQDALESLFIVSSFKFSRGAEKILAKVSQEKKCPRCWHYRPDTGKDPRFPEACPKCVKALS